MLRLNFLGPPTVYLDDQPVHFPTRKALALLVYLVTTGEPQRRETVTALLWPNSPEYQGRAVLRNTLTYLRQALNGHPSLIITRESVHFLGEAEVMLDLRVVSAAAERLSSDRVTVELWQKAVAQARGEFLTGFSLSDAPEFDEWTTWQRAYWLRQVYLVFDRLTAWQMGAGESAAAADTLNRWLILNPLHEETYRRLMQVHLLNGNHEAARQVYKACQTILATELGLAPAPETDVLVTRLRDLPIRPIATAFTGITPPLMAFALPLMGRAEEYVHLTESYRRVQAGQFQLLCLEGEAGIGKSRLATEFLNWATLEGGDVLRGRAYEMGGRLPYQAITDAWRERLDRENAPEDLLADVWLAELSRLLPELRERYPDLPLLSSDDAAAGSRLFEAFARLGSALAARRPVVLYLDDVQWADLATLDLIQYLAQRWRDGQSRILLLLNMRHEALQPHSTLEQWLTQLRRDAELNQIVLRPLTLAATQQLLNTLTGSAKEAEATADFARWLYRETKGIPFFISETMKALLDNGELQMDTRSEGVMTLIIPPALHAGQALQQFLPPGVRDVIRARLVHLSPFAFNLLSAAAVWGQPFTLDELTQMTNLSETDAAAAWDELLARRLLEPSDTAESRMVEPAYVFSHDKIRDVVYTETGAGQRRLGHRRALTLLAQEGAAAAVLAHHALAGQQNAAAFRHSLAAGDAALKLFATRDALNHYQIAHRLLPKLPSATPDTTSHLYRQLGRAHELVGQLSEARLIYETMLGWARQVNTLPIVGLALNRLATVISQSDFDLALAQHLLEEAQSVTRQSGDNRLLAETLWNLAQLAVYTWEPKLTVRYGQEALSLARDLTDPELTARCLNALALGYSNLGRWADMAREAGDAAAIYATLGNRAMEADCLSLVGSAYIYQGQTQGGIALSRQALAITQEIDTPWGQINALVHLSEGLLDSGAYEEALARTTQAAHLARTHQMLPLIPYALAYLGKVQRVLGQVHHALATHQEALDVDMQLPTHPFAELIHAQLCADYALLGQWQEAATQAHHAFIQRKPDVFYADTTFGSEVEALLRSGAVALAREVVTHFGHLMEAEGYGHNGPRFRLSYLWGVALLAYREGAAAEAVAYLEEALGLARQMALPEEEWRLLAKLATLYTDTNQAAEVRLQTRRIIQALAERIIDKTLREEFVAAANFVVHELSTD